MRTSGKPLARLSFPNAFIGNPVWAIDSRQHHAGMTALLILLGLSAIAGCGKGDGGVEADISAHGKSYLAVKVANAGSFNPNIEHGRIISFKVKIEGPGIEKPIEAEFAGDAAEGVIENVPQGEDRKVSVEAVNSNNAIIKAGEAGGVMVGDGVTPVDVSMEAVPIFTNIKAGATIDNTRLIFQIFSDPSNPVTILDITEGGGAPLADISTSSEEILLDKSSGLGRLKPVLIAHGEKNFRVRDLVTGRSSDVTLRLLDGFKRQPAPLFSAAGVVERVVSKFGLASKTSSQPFDSPP